MKKQLWLGMLALGLAMPAGADEVGDLIKELKVPARFAGHKAQFSVEQREFTFEQMNGPEKQNFWIIKDGSRYVAVVPFTGFHGGTIYLLTHDPAAAPTELKMPTERWHIDTAIGNSLRTDAMLPTKDWGKGDVSEWKVGEGTLTLVRKFNGVASPDKWEDSKRKDVKIDTTNTFVLRVDPVLGYVVDATWDTANNPAPGNHQYCSLMPAGLSDPWPGREPGQRVVTCPNGKPGYVGHYENHAAIGMSGGSFGGQGCRPGGFAAYLNETTGWSPMLALLAGTARYSICNVHADLDFIVPWPKELAADAEGMKRYQVAMRWGWLPPEITKHVWEKMEVMFQEGRTLIISVGTVEDFEQEPSSLACGKRGMTFTGGGASIPIVEGDAHSGKKALQVRGLVWPNLPQLVLKPNTKYRLSAWIKVLPATDEQKAALKAEWPKKVEGMRKAHEKKMAKLKKDGKEAEVTEFKEPAYVEPGPAEGYITGNYYEWTPHSNTWALEQATNHVKEGEGWKEAVLEFTTPKWGPFIDPRFISTNGGTALVDDFCLREVKE
jgi:hypothetical protein